MGVDRFITTDPQGHTIRLTEACYTEHILVEHPDMTDDQAIEETIRRAETIAADALNELRRIYYRTYLRRPQHWLIKVVVAGDEVVTAYRVNRIKPEQTNLMAALTIPDGIQKYFPKSIDPSTWWVNYNPKADSLTIYFMGKPVPSVWSDVDAYAYIGFAEENATTVTGLMIEHFSQWLLVPDPVQRQLQPA